MKGLYQGGIQLGDARVDFWYAAVPSVLWSLLTLATLHFAALKRFIEVFSTLYLCRAFLDVLVAAIPLLIATSKADPIEPIDMLLMTSVGAVLPLMFSAAYSYCIALVMKEKNRIEYLNISESFDSADLPYTSQFIVRDTRWTIPDVPNPRVATGAPASS